MLSNKDKEEDKEEEEETIEFERGGRWNKHPPPYLTQDLGQLWGSLKTETGWQTHLFHYNISEGQWEAHHAEEGEEMLGVLDLDNKYNEWTPSWGEYIIIIHGYGHLIPAEEEKAP